MRLSDYFTLEEFTDSQTAARQHIDNTPSMDLVERLTVTAKKLDAVRRLLGKPVLVSSGYRSPALNHAIGGVPTSAHVLGYAADFICPGYGTPLQVCQAIKKSGLKFDQVIEEGTWVHISFDPRMRGQLLTKTAGGYSSGIAA